MAGDDEDSDVHKRQAEELIGCAPSNNYIAIADLTGEWLPGIQAAPSILLAFSEAGRYLAAASGAPNPHPCLTHLDGLDKRLDVLANELNAHPHFREPYDAIRAIAVRLREEAVQATSGTLGNPFRAGNPLDPEFGPETFRGRDGSIRELEEILADPSRRSSILLLAPRRCGKSSLLKMLPAKLPDTIPVYFDLQNHDVSTNAKFFGNLAKEAAKQAKIHRRIDLPLLGENPTFDQTQEWFEKLDQLPEGRRVLIGLDEFRRLEEVYQGTRAELIQLMGLLRATIQHRQRVFLLVSGDAPFDELDQVWNDHFINARPVRLGYLDRETSIALLHAPTKDFPKDAIPEEVAAAIYERTGGQPFLLQAFGSSLVDWLGQQMRTVATPADVAIVEPRVLDWASTYFSDLFDKAPDYAKTAIAALGERRPIELDGPTRRWLDRRCLLDANNELAVPMFAAWLRSQGYIASAAAASQ
ncbi:MAG: hypothetical protein U0Q16_07010 [Bryobacteraceae bacterium]